MHEFTKYIERRQRVEAFQFTEVGQASFVADLLGADRYVLNHDGYDFHIIAQARLTEGQTAEVRVNRGDFLVREGWGHAVDVVRPQEFRKAWEENK